MGTASAHPSILSSNSFSRRINNKTLISADAVIIRLSANVFISALQLLQAVALNYKVQVQRKLRPCISQFKIFWAQY